MQTIILYVIGALAVGYIVMTIWKQIKGQGSCGCTGKCESCGQNKDNKKKYE